MKVTYQRAPQLAVQHLDKSVWGEVNRLHIRKALSEFAHEEIIIPQLQYHAEGWGHYELNTPDNQFTYRFRAKVLAMNHWFIDTFSILKLKGDEHLALDSLRFVAEFNQVMGISQDDLPVYMEEISSTLNGAAYTFFHGKPSSHDLLQADYQQIEGSMAGHPRFIANNGRIGFDNFDYSVYAPESAAPFSLLWLAGHKDSAVYTGITSLNYANVIEQELGTENVSRFNTLLQDGGFNTEDYFFFPIHPWQWYNKLANVFAADIATGKLICLGYSDDKYLPQQSIRTFYNVSSPEKFYVKTSVSILNMGYIRGLSPYFMQTNPGINEWIFNLIQNEEYLESTGFCILREVASVSYAHQYFEKALKKDSHYKKMLACLWRESPASKLKENQQLMTMAALLHVDNYGTAFLPQLIAASGLCTAEWLRHYLQCYMAPLIHCFYKWDMVFMPHGENLILVLENHIPVRAIMKDIGEEVSLLNTNIEVPEVARRLMVNVSPENKTLPLFTQLFDGIFRFISAILVEHNGFDENEFWKAVADCILKYQKEHPEYNELYEQFSLFVPQINPDALNRLQLQNNKQLRNRANPFDGLPCVWMDNPIAKWG